MNRTKSTPRSARSATPIRALIGALIVALTVTLSSVLPAQAAPAVPGKPTAASVGSTAIKVTWAAVTGAAKYTVRYSTSSSFSSYKDQSTTGTSAVVEGLTTGSTYYVKVAAVDSAGAASAFSSYASAKPAHLFAAPTGLAAENVSGTSIELTWLNVPGSPGYRVSLASSGNPTVYFSTITERATVTGLKKGTAYTINVYVEQPPMNGLPALQMGPSSSSIKVTTSTYDLAAPANVKLVEQTYSQVKIAWEAPDGMQSGWKYQLNYALNSAMTSSPKWGTPVDTTSATLTGLQVDTAYYVRVRVVDGTGAQRSDLSDSIIAKTIVATGQLKGRVSGAPASHVVAAAYDSSGEMAQQVDLASDGSYTFDVRPGTYKVQAIYIGTGNYTSEWAAASGSGSVVPSAAAPLSVTVGETTKAPDIVLGQGGQVTGQILDPSGEPVPDVYVTALSAVTSEREVLAEAMTDSSGNYRLRGLPAGSYWLRMIYSSDGFLTRSIYVTVAEGQTLTTNATLDLASFRKTYGAYISGTKTVGKTLTAKATAWLAGSYPTTWATMTVQWKRNGSAISGATNWTYKLTSADKGKKISVTATARRYGYQTGTVTSSSYTVS